MKEYVFFGGYTRNTNRGIHIGLFDDEKGTVTESKLIIEEENPTFLEYDKERKILYSISSKGNRGSLSSYRINGISENPETLDNIGSEFISRAGDFRKSSCYLELAPSKEVIYACNYHEGTLHVFSCRNGILKNEYNIVHKGSGTVMPNQESSRSHFAKVLDNGKIMLECDLGNDSVYIYSIEDEKRPEKINQIKTEPGSGPRHLLVKNTGENYIVYIGCELDNTIEVYSCDFESGQFEKLQKISTLKSDDISSSGSAIRFSKDFKNIYFSNRGDDSISVFRVEDDNTLSMTEIVKSGGKTPRDFNISGNGKYIIAAHQESDDINVMKIYDDGKLKITDTECKIDEIVCVMFI